MMLYNPSVLKKFKELAERDDCESDLLEFLQKGWKYIDPAPFTPGWHLDAIAEHLMAVTDGHIQQLVINVPPRSSKSSLVSVAWPSWTWAQPEKGPLSGPQVQFLSASYAQTLSLRDSVKTRRLIQSPWYQKLWGDRFGLTGDVNTKGRFENDKGGYRLATAVDGTLTGEGGDIILIDDAINATEAVSDVVRKSTLAWWDEAMSTRRNNPKTGAYVIIMQRLHQEDLTGHVVTKNRDGWTWLCLPMRYESDRRCITYVKGEKFWEDPRKVDGDLLCPERFGEKEVDLLEKSLGPWAYASQMQQRPAPRGGGLIKEEWWKHWIEKKYPTCEFTIASLDTAYTEKTENDASALSIWGVFRSGEDLAIPASIARKGIKEVQAWYSNQKPRVILLYQWQERLNFPDLAMKVHDSCTQKETQRLCTAPGSPAYAKYRFKVDKLIIEKKAAGHSVAQELTRQLSFSGRFGVDLFDPKKYGDKIARLLAVQHMWSEGFIYVPWPVLESGEESPNPYTWVEEAIDQVSVFPRGKNDDFVDSASMSLLWLRDSGMALRADEHAMDVAQELAYRPKMSPLYPV